MAEEQDEQTTDWQSEPLWVKVLFVLLLVFWTTIVVGGAFLSTLAPF